MSTLPRSLDQLSKVVIAFTDGRRQCGYTYNFSAMREAFDLLPPDDPLQQRGIRVALKDLKAIFFVRDFSGTREQRTRQYIESGEHGRKIEIVCSDGETIVGKTEGYNPQKPGFFVFPGDKGDNNARIFVINKNAKRVRFV